MHVILMSMKEQALEAIENLPSDADYIAIIEEIQILAALEQAAEQSRDGKTVSHEDVKADLQSWAGK